MNQGVKTIIYPVTDLARARATFSQLLGVEPYVDSPYYVGFKVGDQDIGLDPNGHREGMTTYYHVDNIKQNLQSLLDAGAQLVEVIMENKIAIIISLLAIALVAACTPAIKTVGVTRISPQTLVATQSVQVPVTITPHPSETPMPATLAPVPTEKPSPFSSAQPLPYDYPKPNTVTPTPADTPDPTHVAIMALQDPAIVVVQYYTLLGQHLFKEAYQLIGSHDHTNSPDDEALMMAQAYQVVDVLKVVRYNDWIKQNHINMPPASDNVYYVQLYVVGENMVDMTPVNGIVETYAWTVRENGEVKIEFHGKLPYD